MSIPRIAKAMEYIDDDLVSGAVTYTRQKRKWWKNWKTIAACAAVVALLFGAIPFLNNGPAVSPFVLTAYAMEPDNSLSAVAMQEGENTPVTMFEADNGLWGFVFSYAADDPEQPISVSIMNTDQQLTVDEKIETISGLEMDSTQKYVFFIPPQNEAGPYSLPLTIHDEDENTVALITLLIEQAEGGYTSRIEELTTYPRKEAP